MNKNLAIIVSTLSFSLAILLFWKSGLSSEFIFQPITSIMGIASSFKTVLMLVFASLIMMSIGYATLVASVIDNGRDNTLLLSAIIPLMVLIGIYKDSMFGFFFMAGFALSLFVLIRRAARQREMYKKISPYEIGSVSVKSAFFLISISMTLSVVFSMLLYPDYAESTLRDSLSVVSSLSSNLGKQVAETQLQFAYDLLDSIETNLVTASSIYMSQQCSKELSNAVDQLDVYAREELARSMESGSNQLQLDLGDSLINLLKKDESLWQKIVKLMMITLALGIFAILELLKGFVLAPLTGLFARVFTTVKDEQELE